MTKILGIWTLLNLNFEDCAFKRTVKKKLVKYILIIMMLLIFEAKLLFILSILFFTEDIKKRSVWTDKTPGQADKEDRPLKDYGFAQDVLRRVPAPRSEQTLERSRRGRCRDPRKPDTTGAQARGRSCQIPSKTVTHCFILRMILDWIIFYDGFIMRCPQILQGRIKAHKMSRCKSQLNCQIFLLIEIIAKISFSICILSLPSWCDLYYFAFYLRASLNITVFLSLRMFVSC